MAEELRELRLSKQIPAKDMVAVVQAIYPKYDKTVQSKCENGDAYGVSLRPDAMAALYAHFAPELAEGRKAVKKDAHRLTCRISARLETADYGALQRLIEAEGYATTQDWLTATCLHRLLWKCLQRQVKPNELRSARPPRYPKHGAHRLPGRQGADLPDLPRLW